MDEETIKIVRSYSQKVNLGNYQSCDFFTTRSLIVPADTGILEQWHISRDLHQQCMAEVARDIEEDRVIREGNGYGKGIPDSEFEEELDKVAHWLPGDIEKNQKMNLHQQRMITIVRKSKERDKPKGITQGEDRANKLKTAYKDMPEIKEGDNK